MVLVNKEKANKVIKLHETRMLVRRKSVKSYFEKVKKCSISNICTGPVKSHFN